jgi:hypothetical protein
VSSAPALPRTRCSSCYEHPFVEVVPAYTNQGLTFAGVSLRLAKRASNYPTCRLAILNALPRLPGADNEVVTVDRVRGLLAREGIEFPRNTVYKTMLRMSNAEDAWCGSLAAFGQRPGYAEPTANPLADENDATSKAQPSQLLPPQVRG